MSYLWILPSQKCSFLTHSKPSAHFLEYGAHSHASQNGLYSSAPSVQSFSKLQTASIWMHWNKNNLCKFMSTSHMSAWLSCTVSQDTAQYHEAQDHTPWSLVGICVTLMWTNISNNQGSISTLVSYWIHHCYKWNSNMTRITALNLWVQPNVGQSSVWYHWYPKISPWCHLDTSTNRPHISMLYTILHLHHCHHYNQNPHHKPM